MNTNRYSYGTSHASQTQNSFKQRGKILFSLIGCLLLAAPTLMFAGEPPAAPRPGSPAFERMKSLVGTWKGTADMGMGPQELTVTLRIISGGTAIEERIFEGTPHEMVTIYYDKDGKLSLTHYCMLGNRPAMQLVSADPKKLRFDFDPTCGLNSKTEMHMHALALSFENPDTITADWQLFESGKSKESHPFTLKRVKV